MIPFFSLLSVFSRGLAICIPKKKQIYLRKEQANVERVHNAFWNIFSEPIEKFLEREALATPKQLNFHNIIYENIKETPAKK